MAAAKPLQVGGVWRRRQAESRRTGHASLIDRQPLRHLDKGGLVIVADGCFGIAPANPTTDRLRKVGQLFAQALRNREVAPIAIVHGIYGEMPKANSVSTYQVAQYDRSLASLMRVAKRRCSGVR